MNRYLETAAHGGLTLRDSVLSVCKVLAVGFGRTVVLPFWLLGKLLDVGGHPPDDRARCFVNGHDDEEIRTNTWECQRCGRVYSDWGGGRL